MNTSIFWDITPYCGLKFKQESSMKHRYLLHGEICSSEMSVDFKRNIRRYVPEHGILQNWNYLKSRTGIICIQNWMENYLLVFHPKRIKLNQHSAISVSACFNIGSIYEISINLVLMVYAEIYLDCKLIVLIKWKANIAFKQKCNCALKQDYYKNDYYITWRTEFMKSISAILIIFWSN